MRRDAPSATPRSKSPSGIAPYVLSLSTLPLAMQVRTHPNPAASHIAQLGYRQLAGAADVHGAQRGLSFARRDPSLEQHCRRVKKEAGISPPLCRSTMCHPVTPLLELAAPELGTRGHPVTQATREAGQHRFAALAHIDLVGLDLPAVLHARNTADHLAAGCAEASWMLERNRLGFDHALLAQELVHAHPA